MKNEGSFNALPQFETELLNVTSLPVETCSRGSIYRELVELNDGTRYPVVTGVPDRITSDTAVTFTTAWQTSTKGHNMRTLRRVLKAGYTAVMIGSEEENRNSQLSMAGRFMNAIHTNQPKVAHDMNRVLDYSLSHLDVRDNEIIALGESRGAMLAHGLNIPQYAGKRHLVYADLTAPCFAKAPSAQEVGFAALQLVPEAIRLGKLGISLVNKPGSKHYPETIHKDLEYYPKELLKIPMLMSGDAGKLAQTSMQAYPDTQLHVRLFHGDGWSQAREWEKIYEPYDGVTIERSMGYHLDIATSETLDNIELRLGMLASMRGLDGSFSSVDFTRVKTAHVYDDMLFDTKDLRQVA